MSSRHPSCPCEFPEITPCRKQCSCRTPHLSGGCGRCTTYGSAEQRLYKAHWIASLLDTETIAEHARLMTKCFDLETRVRILELDLRRSKENAENYRHLWNGATNDVKRLRVQVSSLVKKRGRVRR